LSPCWPQRSLRRSRRSSRASQNASSHTDEAVPISVQRAHSKDLTFT
jgi:hypothetical protein